MPNKNCRVCGYQLDFYPWGESDIDPTWEICPCCGVEFGYEDSTVLAAKKARAAWLQEGAKWFRPEIKPALWILEDQINNIPNCFK